MFVGQRRTHRKMWEDGVVLVARTIYRKLSKWMMKAI